MKNSGYLMGIIGGCILINIASGMYDTHAGCFMQQDPLGIQPAADQIVNSFSPESQYADGLNLYQHVFSLPTMRIDAYGLWGEEVHYQKTEVWARTRNGMLLWASRMLAWADNYIDQDFLTSPTPGSLHWHFNVPHGFDFVWGPTDTRYRLAERRFDSAISLCKQASESGNKHLISQAVVQLGGGLHPLQDWVAHGSWDPSRTKEHFSPIHPKNTDNPRMDFRFYGDGILRDWADIGGDPDPKGHDYFMPGFQRINGTRMMTLTYLERFKHTCSRACYCEIYDRDSSSRK
jgi:hypothetical protein